MVGASRVSAALIDMGRPSVPSQDIPPSAPSRPMTRARVKLLHDKVNSLLSMSDLGSTLDGMLLHASTVCVIRFEPKDHRRAPEEEADFQTPESPALNSQTRVFGSHTPEAPPFAHRSLRPKWANNTVSSWASAHVPLRP